MSRTDRIVSEGPGRRSDGQLPRRSRVIGSSPSRAAFSSPSTLVPYEGFPYDGFPCDSRPFFAAIFAAIPDRVLEDESLCRASWGPQPMRLPTSTTGQTSRPTNNTRPVLDGRFRRGPSTRTGYLGRVMGNSRTFRRSRLTTSASQKQARPPQLTTHNPGPVSPRFPVSYPSLALPTSHARVVPCNTRAERCVPWGEPDALNPPSLP